MRKKLLSILALLCLTVTSAWAETIGGIVYTLNTSDHTAQVGVNSSYSGALTIPETVEYNSETYTVTSISDYAFAFCAGLKSADIPASVTHIGNNAFLLCIKLRQITLPAWATDHTRILRDCGNVKEIKYNLN